MKVTLSAESSTVGGGAGADADAALASGFENENEAMAVAMRPIAAVTVNTENIQQMQGKCALLFDEAVILIEIKSTFLLRALSAHLENRRASLADCTTVTHVTVGRAFHSQNLQADSRIKIRQTLSAQNNRKVV